MNWKNQAFVKLTSDEIKTFINDVNNRDMADPNNRDLLERLKDAAEVIKKKKQPTVFDRIDEIEFWSNAPLDGVASFSYSWHDPEGTGAGYEKLESKNLPNEKGLAGGHQFSGVYHPDAVCENHRGDDGPGVCKHCGRTLF